VEAVPPASAFEHPRTERGGGDKDRSSRDGAEAASARASTPPDAPGSPERSNPRSNIKKEATEDAVPAATSSAAATSEPDTDSSRFSPAPGFEKLVVYFLHDEYGLDGRSLETLSYAKQLLRRNPDLRATVTGYTDTMGERRYNVELSRQRAEIVKGYLSGKNIAEERIKARGLGPRNPIASNETLEGRAQNRRVEIVLGYPSE
jgi:outer membrane protein OmpA-like peptidoglycan-associated protein